MIEQIINWWNNLIDEQQSVIILGTITLICLFLIFILPEIINKIKNSRKTITQKWKEGLIGQPKRKNKYNPYSSYQPRIPQYGDYPGEH